MTREKNFWKTIFKTIPHSRSMLAFTNITVVGMGVWIYLPDDDQERHFLRPGNSAQF